MLTFEVHFTSVWRAKKTETCWKRLLICIQSIENPTITSMLQEPVCKTISRHAITQLQGGNKCTLCTDYHLWLIPFIWCACASVIMCVICTWPMFPNLFDYSLQFYRLICGISCVINFYWPLKWYLLVNCLWPKYLNVRMIRCFGRWTWILGVDLKNCLFSVQCIYGAF